MEPACFWGTVIQAVMAFSVNRLNTKQHAVWMLDRLATADVRPTNKAVVQWIMAQQLKPGTLTNYGSRIAVSVRLAFPRHPLIHVAWHVRVALGLAVTARLDTALDRAIARPAQEFTPHTVRAAWLATPPASAKAPRRRKAA